QVRRWELCQVEHVVAANEVLVRLGESLRRTLDSSLLSFRTELELRQIFLDQTLVPDGWIAWRTGVWHVNWFIEVDLHHEGLSEWRDKIVRYLNYAASGMHKEVFGCESFEV